MPKISSYPLATTVTDQDLFVISDSSNNDATKSLELETLKTYINEGGGSGTDNYVDGGSISGDTLTLTRTGSLGDIDITGLLELGTTSTTALAGDTAVGQVQSITTTGTSGAATLDNGVLNIPIYSGGGSSVYSKLETFINFQDLLLFDGQSAYAREIELVSAPGANKVIIIDSVFAYMQPGTTTFDFNTALSISLSGQQNNGFLPRPTIQASMLNTSIGNGYNFVSGFSNIGPFPETSPPGYNYTNKGIVLTNPFATTVSQGNSTLKLNIVYRIVNI